MMFQGKKMEGTKQKSQNSSSWYTCKSKQFFMVGALCMNKGKSVSGRR